MRITDINAPPIEPVTLAGAKEFLRVDHEDEDALILDMIRAARERVEEMARLSLITRRRQLTTTRICTSGIYINHGPVKAVHSVSIIEAGGAVVTFQSPNFASIYGPLP